MSNILSVLPAQAGSDLDTLAANIRTWHAAVNGAMGTAYQHALDIGDALIAAKAAIKHGQWLDWLKRECDLSERTARRYMEIAGSREQLAQIGHTVSDLSMRGALKLIQKARAPASDSALPVEPKPITNKKATSSSDALAATEPRAKKKPTKKEMRAAADAADIKFEFVAARLVEVDRKTARMLYDTLEANAGHAWALFIALERNLGLDEVVDDDASTEPTTADDDLDIPSFLRRQTVA